MASKVAAAAMQYSKQLSKAITRFWIVYRILVLILVGLRPETASSVAETIAGVDTIMMANVSTYLVNSLGEKWIYSERYMLAHVKTQKPKEEKEEEAQG